MPKIVEIERTPNPNAMRFVLKEPVSFGPARSFENAEQAQSDELAKNLFAIEDVHSVFYVDKYITVTQTGKQEWPTLLRKLANVIREAPAAVREEILADGFDDEHTGPVPGADDPRLAQINEMLDEQVRPYLMADGGGLRIMGLENNQLKVHYQGACGTCPSSTSGTLFAIESMVKRIDPEIEVVSV
jgi:Fe-S cluster biogenesis protein NfuA